MGLLAVRHPGDRSGGMSDPMMPLPVIEAEPTSVPPAVLLAKPQSTAAILRARI
jgi:hypothetical protein